MACSHHSGSKGNGGRWIEVYGAAQRPTRKYAPWHLDLRRKCLPRLSSLSLSPPHPAADEHPSRVLHAVAGRGEGPCPVSRGSGECFQDFRCHTGPSSGGSGPSGPGFDSVSRIFGSPVSVVRTRCAWHWLCLASFVGPGEACPRCPRVDGARRRAFLLSGSSELHLSSETVSKEGDFSPGRPGTWGNNGLVGGGVRSGCWAQPWAWLQGLGGPWRGASDSGSGALWRLADGASLPAGEPVCLAPGGQASSRTPTALRLRVKSEYFLVQVRPEGCRAGGQ